MADGRWGLTTSVGVDRYSVVLFSSDICPPPSAIRWYVDGTLYATRTPSDLPGGARWVFDHPFFLLVNVAVGGAWPGNPDAATTFPQELVVDWVRVYRR